MSRRVREHGPTLVLAAAAAWAAGYVSLAGFGWNDYSVEAFPSITALTGGHLWEFLKLAPVYGGSLEMRAPFAFLPTLWNGGQDAVYASLAVPCLFAVVALAVWVAAQMRRAGQSRLARLTAVALFTFNPVTLYALQLGHAEELLGAVLCIAAVLAAQRGHPLWAGLALGLAIANKEWALIAIGPVLLALPGRRLLCLTLGGAVAVALFVPLILAELSTHTAISALGPAGAAPAGTIFQPWQLWWFLGSHGHLVHGLFGVAKPGYRTPPTWIAGIPHPLIIAISAPLTLLAARFGRRDAMLLLVLLLALRGALDTWNTVYYMLPFVLALLAWESLSAYRPPLLSIVASVAVWLLFVEAPGRLSPDAMSLVFAALALPAIAAVAVTLYGPGLAMPDVLRRELRPRAGAPSAARISPL